MLISFKTIRHININSILHIFYESMCNFKYNAAFVHLKSTNRYLNMYQLLQIY